MKPIVLALVALAALPALGDAPKTPVRKGRRIEQPSRAPSGESAPRWLQKKVKPFVNKTVVAILTR